MLHSQLFLSPTLCQPHHSLPFPYKPNTFFSLQPHYNYNNYNNYNNNTRLKPCLAQITDPITTTTTTTTTTPLEEDGPIELPPSPTSIFATTDDPTPLQIATSVLLTGAISVFLFRSVRRRARRAKELKYRSTGAKSIKDEALDNLKAMKLSTDDPSSPPSAIQALLGGIAAGVITLILYKFATTVEAGLNRQAISDNFSVRQITITIRTIINGLCYLATFVFGINSVGLVLYAGQLAINSFMEGSTSKETSFMEGSTSKETSAMDDGNLGTTNPLTNSRVDNKESSSSNGDSSDKNQ